MHISEAPSTSLLKLILKWPLNKSNHGVKKVTDTVLNSGRWLGNLSRLNLHHHPLHLLIWQSRPKHVIWTWFDVKPVTRKMWAHRRFAEMLTGNILLWRRQNVSPILLSVCVLKVLKKWPYVSSECENSLLVFAVCVVQHGDAQTFFFLVGGDLNRHMWGIRHFRVLAFSTPSDLITGAWVMFSNSLSKIQ